MRGKLRIDQNSSLESGF